MKQKKNRSRRPEYKQKKKKKNNQKYRFSIKTATSGKKKYGLLPISAVSLLFIILLAIGIGAGDKPKAVDEKPVTTVVSVSTASDLTSTELNAEETIPGVEDKAPETEQEEPTIKELGNEQELDSIDPDEENVLLEPLEVHFIDVGQGDAILITCAGESMLIDGGNEYKGTTVQLYLHKHNIDSLKYLVASHPDADHIGGLDVIVTKYDIESETVWIPNIVRDTKAYLELVDAIDYRNYKMKLPEKGHEYPLGDAKISFVYATDESLDDNDKSLVVKVKHGEKSFLFTGDISDAVEASLAKEYNLAADVLKVSHHGSKHSTTPEFIDLVKPSYAVFSVGENSYGHPDRDVAKRLSIYGCKLYRTDEQSSVVAVSDGKEITFNVFPCELERFESTKEEITDKSTEEDIVILYVLNTNSKRFHYPNCKSVSDMKEKNKRNVDWTRDECITNGYKPCGNCNP